MRLRWLLLLVPSAFLPVAGQQPAGTNAAPAMAAPRALPVNPAELNSTGPTSVAGGVNVHWYGHGFIYLTSSVGIRCAIDPFGPDTVHYTFPPHLAADFVLVTNESEDHDAADQIFGNPLIFRSVMAVGYNRANGIPFYGVALQKESEGQGLSSTAFRLKFDNISFGYIGQIYMPMLAREKEELGHCDVVFLPVGEKSLTPPEFTQIAKDLGAHMIIPINYQTEHSGILSLRPLDEYLDASGLPVRRLSTDEIVVTHDSLPARPTIYCLKSP